MGVVAELFTYWDFEPCSETRAGMFALANDSINAPHLIPVIWNTTIPNESPNWSNRLFMYGDGFLPDMHFQGIITDLEGGSNCYQRYLSYYNTIDNIESPIDLNLSLIRNLTSITVTADVTMTGNITTTNNNIIFLVTRDINNDYSCNVEVHEIQPFLETTNGEVAQYTQILQINPSWEIDELSVVVMVQTFSGNHDIYQAASVDIEPDSEVNVQVTDIETNEPLSDVIVSAGKFSATTDISGLCTLYVFEGMHDIEIKKAGYIDRVLYNVVTTPYTPVDVSVSLNELILPPSYLAENVAGNWVWLNWQPPGAPDLRVDADFETGLPAGWTTSSNALGWQVGSHSQSQYFYIPDHTTYAYVNNAAEGCSVDGTVDFLYTPEFELTNIDSCLLIFDSYFETYYIQYATVKISTDGGTSWDDLLHLVPYYRWTTIEIDLADYINEPCVIVAFHADDSGECGTGWAIDNVKIGVPGLSTLANGYNIYMDDATTPSNPEIVTGLEYIVTDVPLGEHEFSVRAIHDIGESLPCDLVVADVEVDMPFYPPTIFNYDVEFVVDVTVSWNLPNPVLVQKTDSEGNVYGEAGDETLTRDHIGYNVYRDGELVGFADGTNTLQFQMLDHPFGTFLYQFTSVYAEGESFAFGDLIVMVQQQEIPALFVDDIEEFSMWQNAAYPWITYDLDGNTTWEITNTTFPGSGSAMPFIVFDPQSTTPPMAAFQTSFSGDKCFATFAAESGTNDDWLISQPVHLYNLPYVGFWARSLTTQFGNDEFEVAVSNGSTNVADFTVISGSTPLQVPTGWTRIEVGLGDYEDEMVRIGIHCVSNGTLAFLVDDIGIYSAGGVGTDEQSDVPPVNLLVGNYPNPFNPETTISYEVKNSGPVTVDIYNILGKKVRTLVNENVTAGTHSVVWNGTDDNHANVSSGVYFYKLTSGDYNATRKMILMK
jgi:hypothetical protein